MKILASFVVSVALGLAGSGCGGGVSSDREIAAPQLTTSSQRATEMPGTDYVANHAIPTKIGNPSSSLTSVPDANSSTSRSTFVDLEGPVHEVTYDPVHKLLFCANPQLNQVEVISTTTFQRGSPLLIPQPWTVDTTPDGSTLWVGTTGELLYAVDIASLQVVERVSLPRIGYQPYTNVRELATTANGSLLLRVGQVNSTFEALIVYNPVTGSFVDRSAEISSVQLNAGQPWRFFRSADGSKVLVGFYDYVILYDASTDTFGKIGANGASPLAAIRPDGGQIAIQLGTNLVFLNNQLQEVGSIGGMAFAGSPVYSRDGRYVYAPTNISIIRTLPTFTVFDAQSFTTVGQLPDLFLTTAPPLYCDDIDPCDGVPGGTTLRTSEETGLLMGPSLSGIGFIDSSTPVTLSAPPVEFNLNEPLLANPAQAPLNTQTSVTLNGSNFVSGASVNFGTTPATVTSVSSDLSQMMVAAPASSVPGATNIFATFPGGWSALAPLAFSYGPQISYSLPMGDRTSGGSQITLLGYGFGTDAASIKVTIGGQAAQVISLTPNYQPPLPPYVLLVKAPPGTAGAADLTVSTSTDTTTLPGIFHYWQSVQDFPISGTFKQILFNKFRNEVYMLDTSGRQVDVFSTVTGQFLSPFPTGASPSFMALLPDGSRLAVANSGDNSVSLIDLTNRTNVRVVNVAIPNDVYSRAPVGLAATSTGKLLVNLMGTATNTGLVEMLDAGTLAISPLPNPACTDCTIEGSPDGTKVLFAASDSSSGSVSIYDAGSKTFTSTRLLQDYLTEIVLAPDTNRAVFNSTVLDATDTIESTLSLAALVASNSPSGVLGRRIQSGGGLLYLPLVNGLQIYDLVHARLLRTYGGLSLSTGARHSIALDDPGQTIYLISPVGLEIATLDSVPLSVGHVEPTNVALSGGPALTIRGSGFVAGTQVTIGGVNVAAQLIDVNTLRIMNPAVYPEGVRLSVTNPSGEHFDLDAAFNGVKAFFRFPLGRHPGIR